MTSHDGKCDVCGGLGDYPIIDRYGTHRYDVRCPECIGSGLTDAAAQQEHEERRFAESQRRKYDAAMAEMRARQTE